MPELAEVEYFRRQWDAGLGKKILKIQLNRKSRNFRSCDANLLKRFLPGSKLITSQAHGKQMLFRFSGDLWMGIHLGMTGSLSATNVDHAAGKHDHLTLTQKTQRLVFNDPRQFGAIRFNRDAEPPDWWRGLPPEILSDDFTKSLVSEFLNRRKKSSIKAVLLMQERFPGIGNWLADEILWRARIRPHCPAGQIKGIKFTHLFTEIRSVCREAIEMIAPDWGEPPESWLFLHRWKENGICPRTGKPLVRETIGGRTTCWSPAWQRWPKNI